PFGHRGLRLRRPLRSRRIGDADGFVDWRVLGQQRGRGVVLSARGAAAADDQQSLCRAVFLSIAIPAQIKRHMRRLLATLCTPVLIAAPAAAQDPVTRATHYLETVMDQYHTTYDVYTTADSAGNHFPVRARMSNYDNAGRTTDAE